MAQWTLNAGCYFKPYRSAKGSVQVRNFQCSTCAATATITVGQVVTLNTVVATGGAQIVRAPSSGGDTAAGNPDKNKLEVAITSLIGIAAASDPTTNPSTTVSRTDRMLPVYIADGLTEWIGYCKGAGVVDSTMVGQQKAIIFDSTLKTYFIDSSNSTAALAAVTITDVPEWSLASTNGPVIFKFLSSMVSPVVR